MISPRNNPIPNRLRIRSPQFLLVVLHRPQTSNTQSARLVPADERSLHAREQSRVK